jgi:hypothetical protein
MNTSINGFFPRVSLGFARKIDTDLIAFVKNILTLLAGLIGQYPTPSPSLATITTAVNAFETKVQDALNGGKIEIGARNAARNELLSLMRQLAAYVQGQCDANVQNIIERGFEAVRAPSPVGTLPAPTNPRLDLTTEKESGQLLFKFDRVSNVLNYSVQSAESPDGPWEDQDLSSSTRVIIAGLTPGKLYWARVCANGTAGASPWSAPTSARAV